MGKKTKSGKGRLDKFYHLAKEQGYRARSAFKLVQLAKKFDFLSKSRICIDLCAAPGGWSQVAQKHMPSGSKIIAIDLAPIKALHGVVCIQSDITSDKCRSLVRKEMDGNKADCVLHDGAPNVGTSWASDAYAQNELTLHAMRCACEHLKQGGTFVTKVFRSADYNSLLWVFNQLFNKVDATKPTASRNVSAEIFVMCIGFKAGKIDPRFFDPKWVFMETVDPATQEDADGGKKVGQTAKLNEYLKQSKGRHRGGYEWGDDMRILAAHEFVSSAEPAKMLVTHHKINFGADGSEELNTNPLTTSEIKEICDDLKVCGKRDLSVLLKWRMKILREKEKTERVAQKAEAEKNAAVAIAVKKAGLPAGTVVPLDLAQDVDSAIAQYIADSGVTPVPPDDDSDDAAKEAELEMELAEQLEKRRKEEKRDSKRMMERQKKAEWRKKMSLHGTKVDSQDQPELFKGSERSVAALEDEEKYIDSAKRLDSDAEDSDSSDDSNSGSDSDEGLDRAARLEVDLAVDHELRKLRSEENHRTAMQRVRKKKKETRRQQVMKAWAGEFADFAGALEDRNNASHALRDKEEEEDGDSDSDDDGALLALREAQAEERLKLKGSHIDGGSLEALADGPPKALTVDYTKELGSQSEAEDGPPKKKRKRDPALDGALVPVEEGETAIKAVQRTSRWFSQDIFQNASMIPADQLEPLYRGDRDDKTESEDDGADIEEVPEDKLPQLPLTDKEKRKRARKKEQERLERLGKKKSTPEDEDDNKPLEIAPLEAPKPLVPASGKQGPQKPTDPRELAETLAMGSVLVSSKKSRMELIDAGYNRYSFDGDEGLPDWFTEEESKHNKPELPISKELMEQFRAKLREINARPIRKVAEARARKKRRLQKRMDKLRSTAMSLADTSDMSEVAKARQMRRAINKAAKADQRKVTTVAIKKGGGGRRIEKGKTPKGAKLKVVDKRMKSDRRGEKKANHRNKHRAKQMQIKVNKIKSKGRRGAGKVMKNPKTKGRTGIKADTA